MTLFTHQLVSWTNYKVTDRLNKADVKALGEKLAIIDGFRTLLLGVSGQRCIINGEADGMRIIK